MKFNRYTIVTSIRVLLIFLTLLALSYFLPKPHRLVTNIFIIMLIVLQVYLLIKFVNRINYDFARFLIELKEKDTSGLYFPENLKKNFKGLKYSFQQISDEIKKTRIEKLGQQQYLGYIIENISDGLISFDEDGEIKLINASAKKLLQIKHLNTIWNLDQIQHGLAKKLVMAKPGSHELIKIIINSTGHEFLFRISEVKIENRFLKIVTFQDLKKELEAKEISSWKKLMRVLTHEMMNSLTPITTLSVAIRRVLKTDETLKQASEIKQDELNDIYKNNETIENRSKGLLEFINQYRRITKIPDLKREEIRLDSFLQNIKHLFSEEINLKQIDFRIHNMQDDIILNIDKKLIEQVIINLIKNSIEAVELQEEKRISLQVEKEDNEVIIKITDSGTGINPEIKDDVFVPFFTTKKQGSGIGLSLSKEIMQKHNGGIWFESQPGKETVFYLKFPVLL